MSEQLYALPLRIQSVNAKSEKRRAKKTLCTVVFDQAHRPSIASRPVVSHGM
jgi:hypothetical protein